MYATEEKVVARAVENRLTGIARLAGGLYLVGLCVGAWLWFPGTWGWLALPVGVWSGMRAGIGLGMLVTGGDDPDSE